ncbi:MAG: hypothetical protein ACEPOV_01305 [Hyphomicrobiales bacterium]
MMRKRVLFYFIVFSIFFEISCERAVLKEELSNKMELIIYDSVDLPDNKIIYIKDYNQSINTFVGIFGTTVVGFNQDSVVFSFNRMGDGPEEYNNDLLPKYSNVRFDTDSSLMINSYNKLKYYTLKGDFIKSFKIDEAAIYAQRNILGCHPDDKSLFFFQGDNTWNEEDREIHKTPLEYDLVPNFFTYSSIDSTTQAYGAPEKENAMRIKERSFPINEPLAVLNSEKLVVNVLFSGDFKLFSYDMNNPEKYKVTQLEPCNVPKQNFLPKGNMTDKTRNLVDSYCVMNTFYELLYTSKDTIITKYRKGISEDLFQEEFAKKKDEYKVLCDNVKDHLEYYIKGKKQYMDFLIPDNYFIRYIGGVNKILFNKKGQDLIKDGKPIKRLYFARLKCNK